MATIIGRDPSVFFEALMATCCVTRPGGRPIIHLKAAPKVSISSLALLPPFIDTYHVLNEVGLFSNPSG